MPPGPPVGGETWFRARPRLAGALAGGLGALVLVLSTLSHGSDAVAIFYVLPVALAAMALGRRAGLIAGALGALLVGVAALGDTIHLLDLLARSLPLVLLGALVGGAADHIDRANAVERQLLAARWRQREAAEINDSIIQALAVAKWSLEAGDQEGALDQLTGTIERAERLVAHLLRVAPGDAVRTSVRVDHAAVDQAVGSPRSNTG